MCKYMNKFIYFNVNYMNNDLLEIFIYTYNIFLNISVGSVVLLYRYDCTINSLFCKKILQIYFIIIKL